jgi:hypothetical protein
MNSGAHGDRNRGRNGYGYFTLSSRAHIRGTGSRCIRYSDFGCTGSHRPNDPAGTNCSNIVVAALVSATGSYLLKARGFGNVSRGVGGGGILIDSVDSKLLGKIYVKIICASRGVVQTGYCGRPN